jgi:flagellar motor switch protein FliM
MVVDVDLTVELGTTAITIDDFIHLESGDVVRLDTKTNGAMKMYVEDKLHYMVQPGELDGRMAVQIQHYVEEDVER